MSIFVTVDSNNTVTSTVAVANSSGMTVDELFPGSAAYTATLIAADAYPNVAVGWTGTKSGVDWAFTPSSAFAAQATADTIAAVRYTHETAGITINGMSVDTGRDSQALITGAALSAVIDSTYVCNWKTADGQQVSLTAAQLIAIATAVRAHVQACFDREGVLVAAVAAGTYTDAMLNEGWPV